MNEPVVAKRVEELAATGIPKADCRIGRRGSSEASIRTEGDA